MNILLQSQVQITLISVIPPTSSMPTIKARRAKPFLLSPRAYKAPGKLCLKYYSGSLRGIFGEITVSSCPFVVVFLFPGYNGLEAPHTCKAMTYNNTERPSRFFRVTQPI